MADDDDGDGDDAHSGGEDSGGVFGAKGNGKGLQKKPLRSKDKGKDVSVVNAQLATFNELSKNAEKATAEVDSSIYDYDGVWEDMKAVDRRKKKVEELDAIERKPKYMESLLASAEVRKRDQLRAKEKMLQKEREEEGEEFKDKEMFVTEAYKKQQEELKKLEEEERIREGMCLVTRCEWMHQGADGNIRKFEEEVTGHVELPPEYARQDGEQT